MLYVIGGDLQQAQELVARRQLGDAVAVERPDDLGRLTATDEVVLTGTFIARPDAHAFNAILDGAEVTVRFQP